MPVQQIPTMDDQALNGLSPLAGRQDQARVGTALNRALDK